MEDDEITSPQLRDALRGVFLSGLNEVLTSYTQGYIALSDARASVEAIEKNEEEDWYEDMGIELFSSLTPKEKIVCLAKVAKMFLDEKDMTKNDWYEMWFQATCYVIFVGAREAIECEVDNDSGTERRKAFSELYNEWFSEDIKEGLSRAAKPNSGRNWREKVEELWDSLVESTAEPWADEDFMLLSDNYPPKSDESDFRRSLDYLLKVTKSI